MAVHASLAAFLEEARVEVDQTLERWLPTPPTCPAIVAEAMRYSVFAGGKRLRPMLALAAADAVARRSPEGLRHTSAVDGGSASSPVAPSVRPVAPGFSPAWDLALEQSLALYERGVQLSRFCHARLEEAEHRIEILNERGELKPAPASFAADDPERG